MTKNRDFFTDKANSITFLNKLRRNIEIVHYLSSDRWKTKVFPEIKVLYKKFKKNCDLVLLDEILAKANCSSKSPYLLILKTQKHDTNEYTSYSLELKSEEHMSIKYYPSLGSIRTFGDTLCIACESLIRDVLVPEQEYKIIPCSKIIVRIEGIIGEEGAKIIAKEILGVYENKSYYCAINPNEAIENIIPNIIAPVFNIKGDMYSISLNPISLTTFKKKNGIFHYWTWDKKIKTYLQTS